MENETKACDCRRMGLEWSDIPLRAALAATFIAHGSQKLGATAHVAEMFGHLGVPAPELMAWVVALTEFGGGILLILGLLTRLAALGHMCVMIVAIATVHFRQGFMAHEGQGYEWQLALLLIGLCLVMRGAGPFSLDHLIAAKGWCCCCCGKKKENS